MYGTAMSLISWFVPFLYIIKLNEFQMLSTREKIYTYASKKPQIPVLIDYFSIQDLKMTYPLSHNCISISIYLKLLYKLYIPSNHGFHGTCGVVQNFTFNELLHHFTHTCLCIYSLYIKTIHYDFVFVQRDIVYFTYIGNIVPNAYVFIQCIKS